MQVPLLSLPHIFGTTLVSIPAKFSYLSADPLRVQHWRSACAPIPGYKIGVVWQGNPGFRRDRTRSVEPARFAPLAEVPHVQLVSLQVGPGSERLCDPALPFAVVDLASRFDPASFADAAAAMLALDLVIAVDTAIAHLAGALGVPVWIALPFAPDWRWLLEREDSPWYPSARLFRQRTPGDWDEVFARMARALPAHGFVSNTSG